MAEKPQKLKFPKCEGYGVETLDYGNVSGTHYISFSDQVEKALSKAERAGAKAERERIHQDIAEMQNPYPKDVFVSKKYDSWRQAWDICHKKVMELI